jgi:hypothetical protein
MKIDYRDEYRGYEYIQNLRGMVTKFGIELNNSPPMDVICFDNKGYGKLNTTAYTGKILEIHKDHNGVLHAYGSVKRRGQYVFAEMLEFSDESTAKLMIEQLHTNPYFHGTDYYVSLLSQIKKDIKYHSFVDCEDLKSYLKEIYNCALFIHERLAEGANIFTRAKSYRIARHKAIELMNTYLRLYEDEYYKLTKTNTIDFPDMLKPEKEYIYELKPIIQKFSLTLDLFGHLDFVGLNYLNILCLKIKNSENRYEIICMINTVYLLLCSQNIVKESDKDHFMAKFKNIDDLKELKAKFHHEIVDVFKSNHLLTDKSLELLSPHFSFSQP